jgi:hypothetical protein
LILDFYINPIKLHNCKILAEENKQRMGNAKKSSQGNTVLPNFPYAIIEIKRKEFFKL